MFHSSSTLFANYFSSANPGFFSPFYKNTTTIGQKGNITGTVAIFRMRLSELGKDIFIFLMSTDEKVDS